MSEAVIYTDGGARGNPGPAAIGIVITNKTTGTETRLGKAIGIATNNVAEYKALIKALKIAHEQKATTLDCYLDSELVVKQLNGLYKVKDSNMKLLFAEVIALKSYFEKVEFKHVPREKNKEADKLVNEILDSAEQ